jgi:hypothetical protein
MGSIVRDVTKEQFFMLFIDKLQCRVGDIPICFDSLTVMFQHRVKVVVPVASAKTGK